MTVFKFLVQIQIWQKQLLLFFFPMNLGVEEDVVLIFEVHLQFNSN